MMRTEFSKLGIIESQKKEKIMTITLNVWSGAEFESSPTAGQRLWFDEALSKVLREFSNTIKVNVEYRSNKGIRENNWSVREMFDWLMDSDIHYILTHVHQGINLDRNYPIWNIPDILWNFNLLEFHVGFPAGVLIKCPVFQQDKFKYVDVFMQNDLALPTLQIDLTSDGCHENSRENITE